MRFWKGGRYRRSEIEATPHYYNNFVRCGVEVICHSVGVEVIVTRLFEVNTDFKNVFTLKQHFHSLLTRVPGASFYFSVVDGRIRNG